MSQKSYLTILKIGVYLSFLSIFLVCKSLLFPYITGKQIYFNILTEILFIIWLLFIVKYPESRPKKSLITIGLFFFLASIFLSSIFGVDFNLSFWGDIERMLGVFHIAHFLILYLVIITVFRTKNDWRGLLTASISVAIAISLYGLIKHISYSTIGNTAYVSGYIIFNIYFALILLLSEKNWGIKSLCIAGIAIMLWAFKIANTSGAYVGLGTSIAVLFFLYIIFSKNKKIKIISLTFLIALIVMIGTIFANKKSDFVKNNRYLNSITHSISFNKPTFQTRLISWKTAAEDFIYHPILGTGYGNFAIIFDKHFDPKFYNYTRSETYFDRAHNNLIDIASTSGTLGLLAYLSIFVAVSYYLIKNFKNKNIDLNNFILLICLFVAYFIQNLAVFDSLVTYISLMVALGYIYCLTHKKTTEEKNKKEILTSSLAGYVLLMTLILILIVTYQFNIKPLKMLQQTINGHIAINREGLAAGIEAYKKALSYNTILDRDSRATLVRLISSNESYLNNIEQGKAFDILDYGIELAKKNIQYNPKDSLAQMQFALIANIAAQRAQSAQNTEKFYYYSDQALTAIDQSIKASPRRIPIYFHKAQIQLTRGENDQAISTLKYAITLNEDYYDSTCQLAQVYLSIGQNDEGFKLIDKCIDMGGVNLFQSPGLIKNLISHYAGQNNEFKKILKLYERLSVLEAKNVKIWIDLAKLYEQAGDKDKAIQTARKASALDKSLEKSVDQFIEKLGN
ncbi:O-antigen ligase family protein [Patescibacteria group bacterium]|nr:O-antigen ligase family protein [Patescibacteria group bacterium]